MKNISYLGICKKCGGECCKLGGPTISSKERTRILKTGVKDYFCEVAKGVYEVKTKGTGICPYLAKDKSCSIQDVKPSGCICWPVLPELRNGKRNYIVMQCPLTPYLTKKDILKYKKECMKVPKKVVAVTWDMSTTINPKELKIISKRLKKFKKSKLK